MDPKKIETAVMCNSLKLETEIAKMLKEKKHNNQYAVYYDGKKFFTKTFEKAVSLGIEKYGDAAGFAVKKVTKQIPVLSSLVKL